MEETVSTDQVMRFLRATPQQRAAFDRFLLATPERQAAFEQVLYPGNAETPKAESGAARVAGAAETWDIAKLLSGIHREIAAVRSEFVELRTAKQQLERMLAEGLFAFTRKVDAESFKVLCCILAEGDVAKASRTLGMADGSVRTLMRRWRGMGKPYLVMLDLVRWRKAVGGVQTVALNDNVLLGRTKSADHPALAADLLEKVTEMTGENWQEKAEELEEMLRGLMAES